GRKRLPRRDGLAPADAALPLPRDPELLQRLDVATNRTRVDLQPIRDLPPRDQGFRLEKLEELEEPGGRCEHDRSTAQIEGLIRPIWAIASECFRRLGGA